MTSSLVTYTGHFHLPLPVFAHDSMIPQDELLAGLDDLSEVGLIEFDKTTEIVRLVGWFNERRTPENLNFLKCLVRIYEQDHLPRDEIMARSISELTLAVLRKSRKLKVNKTNPEASRHHRACYLGEVLALLQRTLRIVPGLQLALYEQFSGSDPRLRGYYEELSCNLEELPRFDLLSPDGENETVEAPQQAVDTGTVSEGFRRGQPSSDQGSENPSRSVSVDSKQKDRNCGLEQFGGRPFLTTVKSDLARQARRA